MNKPARKVCVGIVQAGEPVAIAGKIVHPLPNRPLDRGLITEDFQPFSISLHPYACDVQSLVMLGLLPRGHNHGVSELEHVRRNKWEWCNSALFLLIQARHAAGPVQWMVAIGSDGEELVGDVGAPSGGVVRRHRALNLLIRAYHFAFVFGFGLEWHVLAWIFAALRAGITVRGRAELGDFLIDQRAPPFRAFHPHAQHINLAALGPVNHDPIIPALLLDGLAFIAECRGW